MSALSRILKCWLLTLIVTATIGAVAADPVPVQPRAATLVLYSYGYGARGVEVFSDGFIQECVRLGESVADTYFEYLDLERNKDPDYRRRLIEFLERKYRDRPIAAIVTVQQPALGFLLNEGHVLAPAAPAITVQAPIPALESLHGRRIVSVLARFDIAGTLRQALGLFPDTQRVVFVSGSSDADRAVAEDARSAAATSSSEISFEFTVGRSLEEIHGRVATLPPRSIVLFTQYNTDGHGHVAPAYEVEGMLVKKANAPVFGLYDFNLTNGGGGGSVISVRRLGTEAARLSQDVERGSMVPKEAITRHDVPPTPMFDWAQIERWGGNTDALPAGAIVLHKKRSVWEDHRGAVLGAAVALVVLSLLVVALATSARSMARTKKALAQSEAHFRGVFDGIADAVIVSDTERNMVSVNPAFVRMFGYQPQEVAGRSARMLYVDPAMYARVDDLVFNEHATPQTPVVEIECRREDGSTFWSGLKCVALRDADGRLAGYLSVERDITDHKTSYLALGRFKAIVDSSDDAIVSESLEGIVISWNAAAERIFGYEAAEVIGQPSRILVPADGAGEQSGIMARVLRGERIEHHETVRQHKDGRLVDVSVSIAPILDEATQVTGTSWISRDISEQKRTAAALERYRLNLERMVAERTQDLLLAKAQAESANAAKSSFLARMSHEIRTPMNGIIGLAHLLRRQLTDPSQLDRLNKLQASAEHLLALINDILDLSKIEAGRLTLEATEFSLQLLLDELVTLVAPQAEAKGLRLERGRMDIPPWVRGDPTRLRQLLLNYLGNAVKFTDKGSVLLQCSVCEELNQAVMVRFEVVDTGIGIAREKLSSLFQPFEQADTSTTRTFGGTGLGLAINRHLAGLMDGEVGVSSTLGEGSTFWFTARLRRAAGGATAIPGQRAGEALSELHRRHAGARALLVEDNVISAEVAADMLADAGLAVDIARDGVEAVAKARLTAYDVVLMDMQLPRMDGLAATRAIRALQGWSSCPILALSASVFAEDHRRCVEAGMNDFIGKPVQPERLYQTLLRWLDASHASADRTAVPGSAVIEPSPALGDTGSLALLERISRSPVMDRERVMSFSARASRFLELLRRMHAVHLHDMSRVAECLRAGDTAAAMELAHSLKGAASMLGARQLMLAARDLEAELRIRRSGPIDAASLESDMEAVVEALSSVAAALAMRVPEATADAAGVR